MFQQQRDKNQRRNTYGYHIRELDRNEMPDTHSGTQYYKPDGTRHASKTGHQPPTNKTTR